MDINGLDLKGLKAAWAAVPRGIDMRKTPPWVVDVLTAYFEAIEPVAWRYMRRGRGMQGTPWTLSVRYPIGTEAEPEALYPGPIEETK